jgi:hypothetical protein
MQIQIESPWLEIPLMGDGFAKETYTYVWDLDQN